MNGFVAIQLCDISDQSLQLMRLNHISELKIDWLAVESQLTPFPVSASKRHWGDIGYISTTKLVLVAVAGASDLRCARI
jgi:hypothetical protein